MKKLLQPSSVAIIGASKNQKKLGYNILKNLVDYKYKGTLYPINLNEPEILGIRSYKNILDVSENIDLAVIAIPPQFVADTLKECVKKLVPLVVIITAGFKETGQQGLEMENELKEIVKNTHTRIIGPNCLGVINSAIGLNASFAANFPAFDKISFISQSGALGTAFLDWIDENNLGIDNFISIGNKSDIDENFLLNQLEDQKVIACYLEDIKDGHELMRIGYINNKKRPVLVLKPGKSDAAAKAIASHTGSLAGGHKAITTALKQSGYIEVNTIGEMFNKIKAFAWQPIPKTNKIVIVTNAGGPAVITTDLVIEKGMQLADINEQTANLLSEKLPRTANIHNPIDVIGDALSDRYLAAMDAVLREDEVSAMIVLLTPQIMTEIEKTAKYIGEMQKYNKPIIASFIGGTLVEKGMKLLSKEKIPAYHFPETAVDVLSSMCAYSCYINSSSHYLPDPGKSRYYKDSHLKIYDYLMHAQKEGLTAFAPHVAEEIVSMYNIPVPSAYKCATKEEALSHVMQTIKYPCALKISSPSLLHKSDIGGVIVNIKNEQELMDGFDKLEGIIHNHQIQNASIEIQKFISDGTITIVGANRDPNFGTILIFGQGGIYTELMNDISRRVAPIARDEIKDMIDETVISKILHGTRGQQEQFIEGIVETINGVQCLMHDYEFIKSIDINPLIVSEDQAFAVDVKILI